jgi:hypothetical protein
VRVNRIERFSGKNGMLDAGHLQLVLHVLVRLFRFETAQMVTDVHPLCYRLKQAHLQRSPQLRLADHDQSQRRHGIDLEVGQKPDLLQHSDRQQMGLIDDHHGHLVLAF